MVDARSNLVDDMNRRLYRDNGSAFKNPIGWNYAGVGFPLTITTTGTDLLNLEGVLVVQTTGISTDVPMTIGSDLLVTGNIAWKSGTAFKLTLDHTATADRVVTFPNATDTVAELGQTQTFTGQNTFNNGTAPIITATIGPSSTQQHALPAVASDTLALLARSQTFTATNTFSSAAPIILSGTAARVTGKFEDATRGNRPFFQSSATNGDTNVNAMPSGVNTIAKFEAYNSATPGSATAIASLQANNTEVRLTADYAAGAGLPLQLYAGGNKAVDIAIAGSITLPLQPRCRAYNSVLISHTTSGAWQAVTLDSERYDTAAMHSTSSATSQLTAPVAGVYFMSAHLIFAANAVGQRGIAIVLNGATFIAVRLEPAPAAGGLDMHVACDYQLAANDYVEMHGFQSSGGALNMTATGNFAPEFSARMTG